MPRSGGQRAMSQLTAQNPMVLRCSEMIISLKAVTRFILAMRVWVRRFYAKESTAAEKQSGLPKPLNKPINYRAPSNKNMVLQQTRAVISGGQNKAQRIKTICDPRGF